MDVFDTLFSFLLLSALAWLPAEAVYAQPAASDAAPGRLTVGVAEAPPFAMQADDGSWDGVAVHLWRQVAEDLDLVYDLRRIARDSLVDAVASGRIDAALPVAATAEAEARLDLAPSFYTATLGVAGKKRRSIRSMATAFFTGRFWRIVLVLIVLLALVGTIVWALERKANDEFGGDRGPGAGIWAGFWWAGVTMTTIGYGDKAPDTVPGRLVALLWMLVAMGVTAIITATLTTIMGNMSQDVDVPGDLREKTVAAVAGTPAAAYLERHEIAFRAFDDPRDGLRAVKDEEIDWFVHDAPLLRSLAEGNAELNVPVMTTEYGPQRYTFALPEGSSLREPVAQSTLRKINQPAWQALVERYVPSVE